MSGKSVPITRIREYGAKFNEAVRLAAKGNTQVNLQEARRADAPLEARLFMADLMGEPSWRPSLDTRLTEPWVNQAVAELERAVGKNGKVSWSAVMKSSISNTARRLWAMAEEQVFEKPVPSRQPAVSLRKLAAAGEELVEIVRAAAGRDAAVNFHEARCSDVPKDVALLIGDLMGEPSLRPSLDLQNMEWWTQSGLQTLERVSGGDEAVSFTELMQAGTGKISRRLWEMAAEGTLGAQGQ